VKNYPNTKLVDNPLFCHSHFTFGEFTVLLGRNNTAEIVPRKKDER